MQIDYKQLESWLHGKLKPLCVADPVPLSQYVIALIKKDRPEKELREICIDQLEVFLQENTSSFVEDLFNSLKSRSYTEKSGSKSGGYIQVPSNTATRNPERSTDPSKERKRHAPPESESVGSLDSKARRKRSPSGKPKSCTRSKSRSRSPQVSSRSGPVTEESNLKTTRRTRDLDLNADGGDRHRGHYEDRAGDGESRFRGYRGRPGGSSDRHGRQRESELSRQRAGHDRFRSPERGRFSGRSGAPRYQQDDRLNGSKEARSRRRRCRNFDERGFCIFGDQCPFDHGPDALVLPSAKAAAAAITQLSVPVTHSSSNSTNVPDSSTGIATTASSRAETLQLQSVVATPAVHAASRVEEEETSEKLITNPQSTNAVPVYRPTPINQPVVSPIVPANAAVNSLASPLLSSPPTIVTNYGWPNLYGQSAYFQNALLPATAYRGPGIGSLIRHNVIPIPMAGTNMVNPSVNEMTQSSTTSIPSVITTNAATSTTSAAPPAYEPDKPQISMIPTSPEPSPSNSTDIPTLITYDSNLIYTPSPIVERPALNLAPPSTAMSHRTGDLANATLYVTRLPWRLNDKDKLFEHFSKFGNVIRIITQYKGMSDTAMVEFSSAAEAEMTYRNPEPIFSNRFIHLSTWPPSKSKFGRRGGKFSSYGLRSKTLQERLGARQQQQSSYSWLLSNDGFGDAVTGKDDEAVASSTAPKGGRSRWRLERNVDRTDEDLASGDEDDDELSGGRHSVLENERRNVKETADTLMPDHSDINDEWSKEETRFHYTSGRTRTVSQSRSMLLNSEDAAAYMWQQRKAVALKQRKEQLNFLDKSREARQSILDAQKQRVTRLSSQLKRIMSQLEGDTATAQSNDSEDSTAKHLSVSERRALLAEAKRVQSELEAALTAEKKVLITKPTEKIGDDSQYLGSTATSAVALQALPEPLATERRKQIVEVKAELKEVEAELQLLKAKGEPLTEIRHRLIELKRQLVNLETIRPADFVAAANGMNAGGLTDLRDPLSSIFPSRTQTKLDKRPRTLFITGLSTEDVDDFQRALALNYLHTQHVAKHNESGTENPVLEITFCTRDFAEAAMRQFHQFHGHLLRMSFAPPPSLSESNNTPTVLEVTGPACSSVVSSTQAEPPADSRVPDSKMAIGSPHLEHSSPTSTTAITCDVYMQNDV
ncbi:unnamed protein product [Calicophoron daubneyi]|uniref:RNA-binding protein 26 n=1 Tax=Calicophoron daubneyi TaxID=300641 RepID=A0AAV2T650_CALDB